MTFYIENLGCAKNQVDAEVLAADLIKKGYKCLNGEEDAHLKADLIIVNTCAFIESARKEALDVFFELNESKKKGAKIELRGCLGERYNKELKAELVEADAIYGVPKVPSTKRGEVLFSPKGSAFLKISEGCNHRCAFCAIPLIRGSLVSIDEEEIIEEAKRLVSQGIREINLIGQDLAAYGTDKGEKRLVPLLQKLVKIEGDFKIRCLYIHPDFFPGDLIEVIKNSEGKIIPYFDIPVQHASAGIVRSMGRVKSKEEYIQMVKNIRSSLEDSYVRTTFLLGFKGETEETLKELEEFIKAAEFDAASFFEYSREEGTKGEELTTEAEMKAMRPLLKKWKPRLEKLQDEISIKRLERFVSKTYPVLVEEEIEGTLLYFAHAPFQCPDVDGTVVLKSKEKLNIGQVYMATITKVNNLDLEAEII